MARESRTYPLERVQGYTDAVFAIAATLLVLDLTTSAFRSVTTDAGMWRALTDQAPSFFAFVISFLLLSMLWVIHLGQFRDIVRADTGLVWLNNIRLLFIVLIPFTTSVNSSSSDFVAGRVLLPLDFFLAALMSFATYLWAASRDGHLLRDDAKAAAAEQNIGGLAALIAGAVSVVLAPWFGSWAFLAYAFNPVLQWTMLRAWRRRHPSSSVPSDAG